jgi:hypothetical protein
MIMVRAGETVTLLRPTGPTGRDEFGNDVYGAMQEITVAGCVIAPAGASEDVQGRDQVVDSLTVWFPPGTDVRATDKARVRGEVFEVDGSSNSWTSPFTGIAAPVQAQVTRVVG